MDEICVHRFDPLYIRFPDAINCEGEEQHLPSNLWTISPFIYNTIYLFRGAKGNVLVAGRTSSVSTTKMLWTNDVSFENVDHYFILKFDLSWGIRTNMGKHEGIFLNLQCNCHRVASIFIKLINQLTNFIT